MRVEITALRFWKSEHPNLEKCEDSLAFNIERGLFVVADGAGTAAYANVWSSLLSNHFVRCPLLSSDPFEVEWWLDEPQQQFLQDPHIPKQIDQGNWQEQKTRDEGSHSTLATVRVTETGPDSASAQLLVFGDSCMMLSREGAVVSFPLTTEAEFDANPICLPSRTRVYNRRFHLAEASTHNLQPGDTLLLATDAVAKWIISGGEYRSTVQAFEAVAAIGDSKQWEHAVLRWRQGPQAMRDDDSTALILRLFADNADVGEPLGRTNSQNDLLTAYQDILSRRRQTFERVRAEQDQKQIAIVYGDGAMLQMAGVTLPIEQRNAARAVADAWKEVFEASLRKLDFQNGKAGARDIDLAAVWIRHAALLQREPSAAGLINTLSSLGVPVETPPIIEPVPRGVPDVEAQPVAPAPQAARSVPSAPSTPAAQPAPAQSSSPSKPAAAPPSATPPAPPPAAPGGSGIEEQVKMLVDALRRESDHDIAKIANQYPTLIEQPEFSKAARLQVKFAQRLTAFKQAIDENDDPRIVNSYQRLMDLIEQGDNGPQSIQFYKAKITPPDKRRYDWAQENLQTLQRLREMIKLDDDVSIEAVYNAERVVIDRICNKLDSAELQRITEAEQRLTMQRAVRAALDAKSVRAVKDAFQPELDRPTLFTEQEREQIEWMLRGLDLVHNIHEGLQQRDDDLTADNYNLLAALLAQNSATMNPLDELSDEDKQQARAAAHRNAAYKALREAISAADDEQIVARYDPMLEDYHAFTDEDRAHVQLAEKLLALLELWEAPSPPSDREVLERYDQSLDDYTPGSPALAEHLDAARDLARQARQRVDLVTKLGSALRDQEYAFIVKHAYELLQLIDSRYPLLRDEDIQQLIVAFDQLVPVVRFHQSWLRGDHAEVVKSYQHARQLGYTGFTADDEKRLEHSSRQPFRSSTTEHESRSQGSLKNMFFGKGSKRKDSQ